MITEAPTADGYYKIPGVVQAELNSDAYDTELANVGDYQAGERPPRRCISLTMKY